MGGDWGYATDEDVALVGWALTRQQLEGEVKTVVVFETGEMIAAGGYFLLEKNEAATAVVADREPVWLAS